ncbi:MAG: bifunctional adenosylcobinamide kinase/adenosylcobinamide-phosphate guanylyltransferase [Synergistaceae bacterium]|nr:bifunctional adenosylcobinamide kinase/adenosylcobinamide-phosphate guanylyltransferase [Synergistaceae bacterium]
MLIFISGSSGSGKSLYAEQRLIELSGNDLERVYLATSKIYDNEMKSRVARHRLMRSGKNFITIEKSCNLSEININHNSCILLEDLANLTANEIFDNNSDGGKIFNEITNIIERSRNLVLVSCEIFSDGINYDELTENYIRTLAGLHVKLAALADEVIEVNAGLIIRYK